MFMFINLEQYKQQKDDLDLEAWHIVIHKRIVSDETTYLSERLIAFRNSRTL